MAKEKKVTTQPTSEDTKTLVTVLLLIFVTPLGLILMWFWTKWKLWVKLLITLPVILLTLLVIIAAISTIALMAINPSKQIQKAECVNSCSTEVNKQSCIDACMVENNEEPVYEYEDVIEEEETIPQ